MWYIVLKLYYISDIMGIGIVMILSCKVLLLTTPSNKKLDIFIHMKNYKNYYHFYFRDISVFCYDIKNKDLSVGPDAHMCRFIREDPKLMSEYLNKVSDHMNGKEFTDDEFEDVEIY